MSNRGIISNALADIPERTRKKARVYMDISMKIAHRMEEKGMTNAALAERMDATEEEVEAWLANGVDSIRKLTELEEILEIELIEDRDR